MPGTLFVVATPIGNLEDLTFRALRILGEVDLIAAEDTRRTAKLLARYELRKPLLSLREHNESRETPRLLARISAGASIALVSDAGTPGISDPGARLVRAAREANLPVVPIPGPSAVTAALSVSGVPADEFAFMGFPPSSGKAREQWFERLARERRLVVFFESPHRIERTLPECLEVKQPILVYRELTKINEHYIVCTKDSSSVKLPGKGEFTLVVPAVESNEASTDGSNIYEVYSKLVSGVPLEREEAIDLVARAHSSRPETVRRIVKKQSILVKRTNPATP